MNYMTKYILKRDLKYSENYKVGDVCIISRTLACLNLVMNTRCEIVDCCRSNIKVRTLNEAESRFVSIDRSFVRFYVLDLYQLPQLLDNEIKNVRLLHLRIIMLLMLLKHSIESLFL